jgi:DNA-directed RNA polymerase subunit K/omega
MIGGKVSEKSKKATKLLKAEVRKNTKSDTEDTDIKDTKDTNDEDMEDNNFREEEFFNQDSYDKFIENNDIHLLDSKMYLNNDINKECVITPDKDRSTSDIMTYAEYTRVIEERAKQIENGSIIFVDVKKEHDPIKIAEKEIRKKKCPLKIIRNVTQNIKEEWKVNDLILPFH